MPTEKIFMGVITVALTGASIYSGVKKVSDPPAAMFFGLGALIATVIMYSF